MPSPVVKVRQYSKEKLTRDWAAACLTNLDNRFCIEECALDSSMCPSPDPTSFTRLCSNPYFHCRYSHLHPSRQLNTPTTYPSFPLLPGPDLRAIRIHIHEPHVRVTFIRITRRIISIQRPWRIRRRLALQRRRAAIRDPFGYIHGTTHVRIGLAAGELDA